MGRLKRAAKLCCGVLERQPREEKEVRLLEAHPFPVPPLRPLKGGALPRHRQDSVRPLLTGLKIYPSLLLPPHPRLPAATPSFFAFPRHNQKIPALPPADLHVDNSEDTRTQAASPSPHLREYNDYLCKSWMYKR